MRFVVELFTNKIFLGPASGWFFAQVIKVIIDSVKNGFNPERITGGGGMPSSHSATVIGLLTVTVATYGVGGFEFVMALFFAIIVIYDAAGVRLETQRQGKALNLLNRERASQEKEPLYDGAFREQLGHTVVEIIAGIIIGFVCGIIVMTLPF